MADSRKRVGNTQDEQAPFYNTKREVLCQNKNTMRGDLKRTQAPMTKLPMTNVGKIWQAE